MKIRLIMAAMVIGLLAGCGEKPPVGATVRYGILSDSVLQLYNSSHECVNIKVTFHSKRNDDMICKTFQINPISKIEIGALEIPWNFEAGETAVVHVDGFSRELHVKLSDTGDKYETSYSWF